MGCGKNSNDALDKHRGCVCEVVRAIKDIQDTVTEEECECPKNCFLEPLGSLVSPTTNRRASRYEGFCTKNGRWFSIPCIFQE